MSIAIIAGIDEAGRGALAGPVVAAACVFDACHAEAARSVTHTTLSFESPQDDTVPKITDSKILTESQREESFTFITKNFSYGVGVTEAALVDSLGILGATEKAMQDAVQELRKKVQPTYLLIDGRDKFWFDLPHSSIIRGDQKETCIAAASIIAKVTRDRLMSGYEEEFPGYGFGQHKGYGTQMHYSSIQRKGTCPLHRLSFLRNLAAT